MGVEYRLHGDDLVVVVGHRIHAGDRATVDNHLGAGVAVGLEQHRVHVGVWRQSGCLRLHGLGPTDLAAIGSHCTVERHVLRFERHYRHALAQQPAAQRGHQCAFSGIGGGALHHQGTHGCSLR
ncbi:hypothetical protein D3C80_1427570 [compost metagenome]